MILVGVFIFCAALLSVSTTTAVAQVVSDNDRETVEVVGLRRWTIQRLQDSLAKLAPGEPIHGCAATLKYAVHFAETSLMSYPHHQHPHKSHIVVTLVEPEDSAFVQRHCCFRGRVMMRNREWYKFHEQFKENVFEREFLAARRFVSVDSLNTALKRYPRRLDKKAVLAMRTALNKLPLNVAQQAAALADNYDMYERSTSILALSAAATNDTAWYALIRALRDVYDMNTSLAQQALYGFLAQRARPSRWNPAYEDLRALVNGANLFAYPLVLQMLTQIGCSAEDFRAIFQDAQARHLLVSNLQATCPDVSEPIVKLMGVLKPDFAAQNTAERIKILQEFERVRNNE
jgi:hypothetical protein